MYLKRQTASEKKKKKKKKRKKFLIFSGFKILGFFWGLIGEG